MTPESSPYSLPVHSPAHAEGVTQVLFVCRANQCRSPFAAAIATRLAGTGSVQFTSGGLLPGGRPMPPVGRETGHSLGFDFDDHLSREVDPHDLSGFDLILTMARDQARDLIAAEPDLWPRLFTLKQFSRWLQDNPPPGDGDLSGWLDRTGGARSRTTLLGSARADDVDDPLRSPAPAWVAMARELSSHISLVLTAVVPPGGRAGAVR